MKGTTVVVKSPSGGWQVVTELDPAHGPPVKVAARLRRLGAKPVRWTSDTGEEQVWVNADGPPWANA